MVEYKTTYQIGKTKKTFKLDAPNMKQARSSSGRIIWRQHSTKRYGDYHVTKKGKIKATMKGRILKVERTRKRR